MELKKYNKDSDFSYCYGAFPCYELIKSKGEFVTDLILHTSLEHSESIDSLISLAESKNIRISTNSKLIEKLSGKGNVYVMAVFKKYKMRLDHNQNQVLLVNPSDMGNLGTIIRVILGFDYHNLAIIKPCIDIFDPKVIRASMGAIFNINIELYDSYSEYEKYNNNYKYPFMLKAPTTIQSLDSKHTPHTLIFGNEASGLDDNFLATGTPLLIKHTPAIDSLNLSISVGIACYEFNKK